MSININFYNKYLKYKNKYFNLQNKLSGNQLGGDKFMKLIIDEWLSIQAITISKIYGKTFLLPNVNDECKKYSIVNCKTNKICDTYTNSKRETTCVSKHLIQKFKKMLQYLVQIIKNIQ